MIYFMQPVSGGPVKIGFTDNLKVRHKQLETHYGVPLAVLATTEGDMDDERELHARFAHLRFGRTEQFRPAAELMEFISRPLLVGLNPDAVEAIDSIDRKPLVAQMRGSLEWKAWAEKVARADSRSLASVMERALREYAVKIGVNDPPPKR